MTTKERYAGVIKWFQENKPIAETELQYHDPFQLLIAVILSAQCTDKRVNMITPALFEAFPTPQDLPQLHRKKFIHTLKAYHTPITNRNIWWEWLVHSSNSSTVSYLPK